MLLVDDDEVNGRIVEQVLQVFGCMIDIAVDGVGAAEDEFGEVQFGAHGKSLSRIHWLFY